MEPTKSQVNKAGKVLRLAARGEPVDRAALDRAVDVLLAWRAGHQLPLITASMGLRSRVRTAGCEVRVSQRLKRVPTMIDKLERQPTLALATMQDVGGCRAVLGSIAEIRNVQKRFDHKRPPKRVNDYIADPKDSGYRGVHLIVEYDDHDIEIQLRTQVMHEWAITVERLSGQLSVDLKSGVGPRPVLDLLEVASEAMALEERNEEVDTALMERFQRLREIAVGYLSGPGGS